MIPECVVRLGDEKLLDFPIKFRLTLVYDKPWIARKFDLSALTPTPYADAAHIVDGSDNQLF